MNNRLDIFKMMREGIPAEEAIEKAFGELMTLIADLKAENKVNARNYQNARNEAAQYREQWLKAEERTSALIVKNAYLDGVVEQRNAQLKREHDEFVQAVTDPENQPSQWGTVTLAMYEKRELDCDAAIHAVKNELEYFERKHRLELAIERQRVAAKEPAHGGVEQ